MAKRRALESMYESLSGEQQNQANMDKTRALEAPDEYVYRK